MITAVEAAGLICLGALLTLSVQALLVRFLLRHALTIYRMAVRAYRQATMLED